MNLKINTNSKMQRRNRSSYLSEDNVLGFLANDESEEEVSDSDWIGFLLMTTEKKYLHVIYLLKQI